LEVKVKILALFDSEQAIEKLERDFAAPFELTVVHNIISALLYLQEETPDVILCQMHLEDESIFDFIKLLPNHATARQVPVVSCYTSEAKLGEALDSSLEQALKCFGHQKCLRVETFYSYFLKNEVVDATRRVHADPRFMERNLRQG
jgi:DNA-binding NarL/FixJ family response regulator